MVLQDVTLPPPSTGGGERAATTRQGLPAFPLGLGLGDVDYANGFVSFGPQCTRVLLGTLRAQLIGAGSTSNPSQEGKAMATKANRHARRSRRPARAYRRSDRRWLLVLIARTLATILTVIVTRLLGVTACSGR